MTCALNEAVCIAFTLEPFLRTSAQVVFLDTGSTDGTEQLVRDLFDREITHGKLIVEQFGPLPRLEIGKARQRALEILRSCGCEWALKIDADDVFYDTGALTLVTMTEQLPKTATHLSCKNYELYQYQAVTDIEWLQALRDRRDIFMEMSFVPEHKRAYRINTGAYAAGFWGDEAAGKPAENIFVPGTERCFFLAKTIVGAHYGWALPVRRKEEKIRKWYGRPDADPRVNSLHTGKDWRKPRKNFTYHPESIGRLIHQVLEWIEKHPAEIHHG